MNHRIRYMLPASLMVVACVGPQPSARTEAERTVVFCAPVRDPAAQPAGGAIHFPDTLRIVRDTAWASVRIDTSAALASGHDWFRASEPIALGGVRYFRGGGTLAARGVTDGETGHPWVRVTERDGVPFYAHLSDVSEPRMLFAPVGLPCLLMPYVHQDDVRVHPPR